MFSYRYILYATTAGHDFHATLFKFLRLGEAEIDRVPVIFADSTGLCGAAGAGWGAAPGRAPSPQPSNPRVRAYDGLAHSADLLTDGTDLNSYCYTKSQETYSVVHANCSGKG